MGASSLYLTAAWKLFGKIWRLRAGLRATDNQATYWGGESGNKRAFPYEMFAF